MKPSRALALPTLRRSGLHQHSAIYQCRVGPVPRAHVPHPSFRTFHAQHLLKQELPSIPKPPSPHRSFYKTHGRALFKALTLSFFTYQVWIWAWLVLETEEIKDQKSREMASLEGEVRLLEEGRKSHSPGKVMVDKGV